MLTESRRIVVGYDATESAGNAVDWAATEARRRGLPLTVLRVLDFAQAIPGPVGQRLWSQLTTDMIEQVAMDGAARARKIADSVEVHAVTELGQAASTLIQASREAEMLVLGTRGHGNVIGAALGSVAFAVSAHARCPVVVVHGDSSRPAGPSRPVVVGVDESAGADAALRFAAGFADEAAAPLIVVSAYQPALLSLWAGVLTHVVGAEEDPGYDLEARASAERVAAAAGQTARERHPDLNITERAVAGPTAGVIATASYQAGMLVVGCRGRGGFAGLMLGSVSHHLIHSARCPVAVVPSETA
jgi:nucleotide-binding universal stress UspA family protein